MFFPPWGVFICSSFFHRKFHSITIHYRQQEIWRVKKKIYLAKKLYNASVRNNELLRFKKHIILLLKELEIGLIATHSRISDNKMATKGERKPQKVKRKP